MKSKKKLSQKRITFIGAGSMRKALIEGLINSKKFLPSNIMACDLLPNRNKELEGKFGIRTSSDNKEGIELGDLIFTAVPPSAVRTILEEMANVIKPHQIIISVAAAIPTCFIENAIKTNNPVIRIMPNIPSLIGEGMNAVAFGKYVDKEIKSLIQVILTIWGRYFELSEEKIDVLTPLTAMGPTYIFPVIDALIEWSVEKGLSEREVTLAAAQTVAGAGKLVLNTGKAPEELKAMIGSQPLKEKEEEVKDLLKEAIERAYQSILKAKEKLLA